MSITIIGDIHGRTKTYQKWLRDNLDPEHRSIQIGDMGLGFSGVGLPAPGMPPLGDNHKFFRGSHDSPKKCREYKNYLGDYGYLAEDKIFWCAGALSIDRQYRIEGISWWADEELSYDDLGTAIDLYVESKPRFVLSHEAPAKVGAFLLYDLAGPYFAMKSGCQDSRTAQALEAMLSLHQPEKWIFGHYHVDKKFHVPGYDTEFICVGGIMNDGEQPHTYELKT
jgi:calcineurin-like phosphoesterase family protein